jgi:hypothetical protein
VFFRLSSLELWLLIFGIVLGTTLLGVVAGRRLRSHADTLREPFGVLQAALLGLVALILAFGLTLAVGRYDARRTAVVETANAIGTTYLRAQTLQEPIRIIEVVGASVALGLLALYLAILARGVISVVLAAAFVSVLLLITFDLDRPVRGLVTVPNTPLVSLRASMELPPAARAPGGP